ncbi:MAG: hydrogenase [Gemmatimonadaceae bacterium]
MTSLTELILFLIVLSDFAVLGTSRLSSCIRAVALQGLLLGLLPLVIDESLTSHAVGLAVGTVIIKAVALPAFLRWAIREAAVRREVEPLVGYTASLALGVAALAVAFAVANVLPLHGSEAELLIPAALVTVMIGLTVLITRAKALLQVVGYLMLENGIYLFGLTQARRVPFLVEAGVLLDVFVAVFIMGIVVFHINREFDSISASRLTELRE